MQTPPFELERRARNRLILLAVVRIVVTTLVLAGVYVVFPVSGASRGGTLALLVVGLLVIVGVLVWQVRSILAADHPLVRAIEAIAIAIPLLIVVFSLVYLSLSLADRASFSEPLDRISAVYFSVTVLSTVGFGDISAVTDAARIAVTIQMLLDLAVVAVVVRLFIGTARATISKKGRSEEEEGGGAGGAGGAGAGGAGGGGWDE